MTALADPALLEGLVARAARPDLGRFEAQLRSSGYCARPVRLRGSVHSCDGRRVWSTSDEPDGILRKACANRREAVCPPCAERYRQDAYHLIAAGLRGGKGVPDSVVEHPAVFVTLTAPSFGPVHTRRQAADGRALRCRPRRDAVVCPHGVRMSCGHVHDEGDDCLGKPICPECFDYPGAVTWNNAVGELWRRTTIYLPRTIARLLGVTQRALREQVRFSYAKTSEYHQRGLVHLHAVIRLDRAMPAYRAHELRPPSARYTAEVLAQTVRATVRRVAAKLPSELGGGHVHWGAEFEVRAVGGGAERSRTAGYLAKYTTKSTEQAGGLLHRITEDEVDRLAVSDHVRRFLRHAFELHHKVGPERRGLRARLRPPRALPDQEPALLHHLQGAPRGAGTARARAAATALRGCRATRACRDRRERADRELPLRRLGASHNCRRVPCCLSGGQSARAPAGGARSACDRRDRSTHNRREARWGSTAPARRVSRRPTERSSR